MTAPFLFFPTFRALDSAGLPLAAGKLYTYAPGGTTPKATYTDAAMSNPNTNPVILDSTGSATVRLAPGGYHVLLKDSAGNTQWDQDYYLTADSIYYYGGAETGIANSYILSAVNLGIYQDGVTIVWYPANTNTGASTINVNTLGATAIVNQDGSSVIAGQLQANRPVVITYKSTQFILESSQFGLNIGSFGPETSIVAAATVDLGTVVSHSALVTGNTGITSFGSSASTSAPYFFVRFSGTTQLTNSSSLLLPGQANITTNVNDFLIAEYLGSGNWQVVSYQPYNQFTGAVQGTRKNLLITSNGTGSVVTITADELVLEDANGNTVRARTFAHNITLTNGGAGGLDTGSIAASTEYHWWAIYNPLTNAFDSMASLSSSAPTMPSGYTFKCRLGGNFTDGSKHPYSSSQRNDVFQYIMAAGSNLTVWRLAASGGAVGTITTPPTYVSVALGAYVLSTAFKVSFSSMVQAGTVIVAPNNQYGGYDSTTKWPPAMTQSAASGTSNAVEWVIESTNLYWGNNGTQGGIAILGWRDNL